MRYDSYKSLDVKGLNPVVYGILFSLLAQRLLKRPATRYRVRYRSSLHPAPISSTLSMEATGSIEKNGEGKITFVHDVKAYTGRRGITPLILNLRSGRRLEVIFTPRVLQARKRTRVPTRWASEPFWDVSKGRKISRTYRKTTACGQLRRGHVPEQFSRH